MDTRNESSEELSTSLMGHEKTWLEPRKRDRVWTALAPWRWALDTVLLVVILVLVLRGEYASEAKSAKAAIGSDISGFAPECESSSSIRSSKEFTNENSCSADCHV